MKLKVYKGTDEIGGSCVELKTENTTILIDYGTPLGESKKIKIGDNIDAILISHPHQDHFGEITKVDINVPVYCGKLSRELMNSTRIFTGKKTFANDFKTFEALKTFKIGDFEITPYLVDHSAPDAYAFLIKADGKKVLYSGDFRASGRKSKLMNILANEKKLKNVDILLMEGTMLKRENGDFPDEKSVEDKIYQTIKDTKSLSFMIGSSQNIDRIVSAYRASKKAKKIFVIDIYTAWVLEKMEIVSKSVPNMNWEGVKVIKKYGGSYYKKLLEYEEYFKSFKSRVFKDNVALEDIEKNPQKYFVKISPWHIEKMLNDTKIQNPNIIYSQWLGYLKEDFSETKTVQLFEKLKNRSNWIYAHTSGHADLKTLKKFASSLQPKKLIPIHTEYKEEFEEHFDRVMVLDDGESFDINNDNLSLRQVNELNELFKDELEDDNEG